jgi:oleate hydratase
MTDASVMDLWAPQFYTKEDSQGWHLGKLKEISWICKPEVFNSNMQNHFGTFTVSIKDTAFFDQMEKFSVTKQETGKSGYTERF